MQLTTCPICGDSHADREIYPANFRPEDLTAEVFSARRLPDRLHYRMVRCGACGLLRSSPILPSEELMRLYAGSRFTYGGEADFARRTYGRYLRRALSWTKARDALLEIGCGSGFFLEEALQSGLREVAGVEPSADAVSHAREGIRSRIRPGLYESATFPAGSFDVICAFQVFDHVPDPGEMLRAAHRHLRDGGVALFVNHDAGGLLNRLLGEASPIVDVEHTVLFDKRTMRRILERCGFTVRDMFTVRNTYPLNYWMHLAPIPRALKARLHSLLERSALGGIPITLAAGNLGAVATKG